jgi:HK97 family phage portal protein
VALAAERRLKIGPKDWKMGLMGRFVDFILGKTEQRSMSWWAQDWEGPFGPTAGMPVNSTSIMGLSAAWNAVSLLSDSIATLPADVVLDLGDRREPVSDVNRPLWLDNPGNGLSRIDFLNQAMVSLLIKGEAIFLTPRIGPQVVGLKLLDPSAVQINDGRYTAGGQELGPDEILHVRGLMMPGDTRGMGVVTYAREAMSGAMAAQRFGEAFFGNGAWMGTAVEVPGVLSEDGQKALIAYINERHRGPSRAHKIGVLTEGAKLSRPLTFSAEDSQFLETREFQVADIARWFRVPPEMIGGNSTDALTYSTLEGRGTHFVRYSCLPWIVRLEQGLTSLWRSEGGPTNGQIKLNVNGLLRGSTKERYDAYKVGLDGGWLTKNEIRALEDLPPMPEGITPTEEQDDAEQE